MIKSLECLLMSKVVSAAKLTIANTSKVKKKILQYYHNTTVINIMIILFVESHLCHT